MSLKIIAIDWSGAVKGARQKIWLAEVVDGAIVRLEKGRDRSEMANHLTAEIKPGDRVVIGLDFAFSLPSWYLKQLGLDRAADLWTLADTNADIWLKECLAPFWGLRGKNRPRLPDAFRQTERLAPKTAGIRPKSVFQIGGAGAVGTGSLRGMRLLHQLHQAGFSIWPFDPPHWPCVVEIYPRLLTGPVKKSDWACRLKYLQDHFPELEDPLLSLAGSSEDAFDATVSALVMAKHCDDLMSLPLVTDEKLGFEGIIWYPNLPLDTTKQIEEEGYTRPTEH